MRAFVVSFCLLLALPSTAQTFGLKTGLALATYKATYRLYSYPGYTPPVITGTSLKPGFIFGGFIEVALKKNLFLRPGAELVVKGADQNGIYSNNGNNYPYRSSVNIATVDLPLNILYKTKTNGQQRWLVGGGLVPGVILESDIGRLDLGLNIMAGYEFPIGVSFNLNYTHGLVNTGTSSFQYQSLYHRYGAVSIGYFF